MAREIELTGKSYATKDNLRKAIKKAGLSEYRHVIVRNDEGRFCAIFYGREIEQPMSVASQGFMIVG